MASNFGLRPALVWGSEVGDRDRPRIVGRIEHLSAGWIRRTTEGMARYTLSSAAQEWLDEWNENWMLSHNLQRSWQRQHRVCLSSNA